MRLTSISGFVVALAIASAPAYASLVGQSITMTTGQTGSTTITGGQGPTTVISPGLEFTACAGPNSDGCVTSGLTVGVDIEADTINFSFFGSTSSATGTFTITLSGFSTNITSVSAPSGPPLYNGGFGVTSFTSSSITFTATSGSDYHADSGGGSYYSFVINGAPQVTTNPNSSTVCEGSPVTFTAAASGTPTPTVQWQFSSDGGGSYNNFPGGTSTTLSFSASAGQNGYLFRAVFTNSSGSVPSAAATLIVFTGPVVSLAPVNQSVVAGQTATFTTAATANPPNPLVQWYVSTNGGGSFNTVLGANSTTLSFVSSLGQSGNQYKALFSNSCGNPLTTAATLSVGTVPIVTSQSGSQGVCEGRSASYLASASGTPTPSVQWEESTDGGGTYHNVVGATSTVLNLNSVTGSMDGNLYRAKFNNGFGGDVFSNPEPLAVYLAPHITLNPVNQSAQAGQTATFTAAATGTAPITVQWQVSSNGGTTFSNIPGATSTTLSFVVGLADAGNLYRAVFTNLCSTGTNTAAASLNADQGSYLVRYASNLTAGDSVINISNSGANGNNLFGPGFGAPAGNICVNVYAFSPDEQLVSCCSCLVTPNGLVHMTANNDLVSNTLTGIRPSSIVIKMVATSTAVDSETAPFAGSSCANSAALAGTAKFPLADGAHAWGTTLHTDSSIDPPPAGSVFSITETPFLPASLDSGELASIANRCTNIIGNGSTFGVCRSCRLGGLGGAKQ